MYKYEDHKPEIFSEEGQKLFLEIRDRIDRLIKTSGACMIQNAICGSSGDSWTMLACVDRLIELGELKQLKGLGATQHDILIKTKL